MSITPDSSPRSESHKTIAVSFLQLAASPQVKIGYERYVAPNFRHHNGHYPGNAESLMKGMEENAKRFPHKILEVKQTIAEGDRVAVLSHVRLNPGDLGLALVHIFRFENDKIVELWDIGMAIPENSPNESGVF